jgi:hypothetical protein
MLTDFIRLDAHQLAKRRLPIDGHQIESIMNWRLGRLPMEWSWNSSSIGSMSEYPMLERCLAGGTGAAAGEPAFDLRDVSNLARGIDAVNELGCAGRIFRGDMLGHGSCIEA